MDGEGQPNVLGLGEEMEYIRTRDNISTALEGTTHYVGLLLYPAEGFGLCLRLLCHVGEKRPVMFLFFFRKSKK